MYGICKKEQTGDYYNQKYHCKNAAGLLRGASNKSMILYS